MKIYEKIVVYDFEDTFDDFCVEVHHNEDASRVYLYHKMMPHIKGFMFSIDLTKNEDEIRDLIESTVEEYIEEYLRSVIIVDELA